MANNAHILLFHVEPLKAAHIESLCKNLGIRTSRIKQGDYSQKLAYLAGIPGFSRENIDYAGPEFSSEMMVFCNMADMLDQFLSEYKKQAYRP